VKILHVVASYLPAVRYGGTIVSVHGLCKSLVARGHDVHVFTTSVDGPRDSPVRHGEPVDLDGVSVWYFRSRFFRRLYWSPPLAAALAARVREFDVVHTHAIYLWPLWAAARAARRAGVPYVVSPRGMLEKGLIHAKSRYMKAAWIGLIEKRNLEHAAAIHVTSDREANEVAAFGFALPPLQVVPNGVEFDPIRDGGLPSAAIAAIITAGPFLLFLGRLNWKKGLDRLIAALPGAPGVRVVIAGNDEDGYRVPIETQAARLGVGDRIVFGGPVFGADKFALLDRAQALVLPSYSENFGNVVLEAMAFGCPVIVTPEVGLAPVVDEAGAGLVAEGNPTSLASAIARLMGDTELRRRMGECGRRIVAERFTWPAVAERMERAYQSAIDRPPAPE